MDGSHSPAAGQCRRRPAKKRAGRGAREHEIPCSDRDAAGRTCPRSLSPGTGPHHHHHHHTHFAIAPRCWFPIWRGCVPGVRYLRQVM
jgi:hypothetical protein